MGSESSSHKNNRSIICDAFRNPGAFDDLKKFVLPSVERSGDILVKKYGMCPHGRNRLIEIGMHPFEHALRVYVKNKRHMDNNPEHFRDYFTWWARQSIHAHLKECRSASLAA